MSRNSLCAVALGCATLATTSSAWSVAVTATDYSGSSTLSGGVLALHGVFPAPLEGTSVLLDSDLDGMSDGSMPLEYHAPSFGLAGDFFLLHISAGNTTAYSNFGIMSTTMDWALTGYSDHVLPGLPLQPTGSVMFGTAEFQDGRTILHVSEGVLWSNGIFLPEWVGYKLNGFNALQVETGPSGTFVVSQVPSPPAALAMGVFALLPRRRRR